MEESDVGEVEDDVRICCKGRYGCKKKYCCPGLVIFVVIGDVIGLSLIVL